MRMIPLKHSLYCLFAKQDFTRYLEQNEPEEQPKQRSVALADLRLPLLLIK